MSNYGSLSIIVLRVIVLLLLLRHHRIATILATWSALCFGWLVYLLVGRPRILRLSDLAFRRRLLLNMANTAVFFALWALAAFYGQIDIAVGISEIYLAGFVLYRAVKAGDSSKASIGLLATILVSSMFDLAYVRIRGSIVACTLPVALAMSLWTLLIGRRRVFMPELKGLGEKMRDRITQLRDLEDNSHLSRTSPA
jgi:hypothetical protein